MQYIKIDENYELEEELPNEMGDSISYRRKSPFGMHFNSILKISCYVQNLRGNKGLHYLEKIMYIIYLVCLSFGHTLYFNMPFMDRFRYWPRIIPRKGNFVLLIRNSY